jgi:toxin YoeB
MRSRRRLAAGSGLNGFRDPYVGIGKPEMLKHAGAGYWARRITDEHRLVYKIEDETVIIVQVRYHYE